MAKISEYLMCIFCMLTIMPALGLAMIVALSMMVECVTGINILKDYIHPFFKN